MLVIIIYYSIVFLILYSVGNWTCTLLGINIDDNEYHLDLCILVGLSSLTCLASFLSILIPINSLVILPLLVLSVFNSKSLIDSFKNCYRSLNKMQTIGFGFVWLLILIVSAQYISIADTAIHHAQAVQWIGKFGVTHGLANLQPQIGFNSLFFVVQSAVTLDIRELFTGYDLLVYPLNAVLFLMLITRLLYQCFYWNTIVFDHIRIFSACLFFMCLLVLPRWASSTSPDMILTIITIYLFMFFLSKSVIDERIWIIIVTCALTYKLSAAMLGLFIVYLFTISHRKKRFILFSLSVFLAFFSIYFYRNYVISGYLIFPLYFIDIFDPDWKYPFEAARYEYLVVRSWARVSDMSPVKMLDMPLNEWLPIWFERKDLIEKFLVISPFLILYSFSKSIILKNLKFILFSILILASFLFWFFGAPDPRFAYGILFINISFFIALLPIRLISFFDKYLINTIVICGLIMSIFYHRGKITQAINNPISIILPLSFIEGEYQIKKTNFELKFASMRDKNPCNNTKLPCSSRTSKGFENIYLRDSILENGFIVIEKRK